MNRATQRTVLALAVSAAIIGFGTPAQADSGRRQRESSHQQQDQRHHKPTQQEQEARRATERQRQQQQAAVARQREQRQGQEQHGERQLDRQRHAVPQRPAVTPQRHETRTVSRPTSVSRQRQEQLIEVQRHRRSDYEHHLQRQRQWIEERGVRLRQQRRTAQYRFQQQYLDRLRRQQLAIANARYDYSRDPFFYTPASYAYVYGGRRYETNRYGVAALRDALELGYQQGYQAAVADLQDHWGYDYRNCYAYQDANYGYTGLYIGEGEYNYYFREGFRRGYDDGYYRRHHYGRYEDGTLRLVADIVDGILQLHQLGY